MSNKKMINVGCGSIYHPDWLNLDVISSAPEVIEVDITKGLPFNDAAVSVCYSSHVLEHLDRKQAMVFIKDCARVLESGGVIRLVVPDLEMIAREYLASLQRAVKGEGDQPYQWMMLELYDQVVRHVPGGEMATYLATLPENHRDYVRQRIGAEAEKIWAAASVTSPKSAEQPFGFCKFLAKAKLKLAKLAVRILAGKAAETSFNKGLFRDSGEVHLWMYDRYSLAQLLNAAGFVDVKVMSAHESRIPDYANYELDVKGGLIRKPDSLFVEAVKP